MPAPISGARPIHSVIGAASIVTASAAAVIISAPMNMAATQGETPCRLAYFRMGEKVVPIRTAAKTGSRIGRPSAASV